MRKGPYGFYVQLGEGSDGAKPKRASLPKSRAPEEIDLDTALAILALPREVGRHPETGEVISAGIGRFGPYLKHGNVYKSLPAGDDVLEIGMNRAVELLADAKARPSAEPIRTLGDHPQDSQPVAIFKGRYGPYLRHGRVMASLPKGTDPEAVTMEQAVELLAAKAGKDGGTKSGRKTSRASSSSTGGKKAAPRKTAAKKDGAKKTAARSTPRKAAGT